MSQKIIIRHISGTRKHQTDEFQADAMRAITAGRSDAANIRLDSEREDMVSREHLCISPQASGSHLYLLSDLNSRSGTFLNRRRIGETAVLRHNDVVQLGLEGPEFKFELNPPPAFSARPTRLIYDQTILLRGVPARQIAVGDSSTSRPIDCHRGAYAWQIHSESLRKSQTRHSRSASRRLC